MSELRETCRGKWKSILPSLGVDSRFLTNRNGPCPFCGGKDRFRFDDKEGRGTFFCNQCANHGRLDGIEFAMRLKGWSFKEAAAELERLAGVAKAQAPKAKADRGWTEGLKERIWQGSKPVVYGDVVSRFLDRRAITLDGYPGALRTCESCLYRVEGEKDSYHPAMIAMVQGAGDGTSTLHRTYLTPDGNKAPVKFPRKLLSGLPQGGSVRLAPPAKIMGVAEGIETALAASILWGIPVWAAINSVNMKLWRPPAVAEEIYVFGDNDHHRAGRLAAEALAHRLIVAGRKVHVEYPLDMGMDFNDVLMAERLDAAE